MQKPEVKTQIFFGPPRLLVTYCIKTKSFYTFYGLLYVVTVFQFLCLHKIQFFCLCSCSHYWRKSIRDGATHIEVGSLLANEEKKKYVVYWSRCKTGGIDDDTMGNHDGPTSPSNATISFVSLASCDIIILSPV